MGMQFTEIKMLCSFKQTCVRMFSDYFYNFLICNMLCEWSLREGGLLTFVSKKNSCKNF